MRLSSDEIEAIRQSIRHLDPGAEIYLPFRVFSVLRSEIVNCHF